MIGQRSAACLAGRTLCLVALIAPFLLALATRQLPDVPEHTPLQIDGAGSSTNQGSGPVLGELHPPSPPAPQAAVAPSVQTRTRFVRHQRVPITGLVRGQKGRLVTFRLRQPFTFIPDRDAAQEFLDSLEHEQDALAQATHEATPPGPSDIGKQYHAIRLPGNGLDGQVLEHKKEEGVPFYALSSRGKVWFFDIKDGKEFSYTDKISASDREYVTNHFRPVSVAEPGSSDISAQALARQSQVKFKWLRKLAKGAKTFFSKPFAFIKYHLRGV
ncbi:hypothetical protein NDA16_000088 [Ustilago loliicola]|nr:hypothetical protein NDA16_000088 [Ustilago loliicola]